MRQLPIVVACLALAQGAGADELDDLLTAEEQAWLLGELARVEPPERLKELATYGTTQSEWGGGFYGMVRPPLAKADAIAVPGDPDGRREAALFLARERATNLEELDRVNASYPLAFGGADLPAVTDTAPPGFALELDITVLSGFFAALDDGEVSQAEAERLAALPANQEMLRHRRDLGYVPEPLPTTESLARMIRQAGSPDPLDRIWCWVHPWNAFDYCDLVGNTAEYRQMLTGLDQHGDHLTTAALVRVARYAPEDARLDERFALTVSWGIRGWATSSMAGLSAEHVKDDWDLLLGTLTEETYHRLQLQLLPTATGQPAGGFEDLTALELGDARYEKLHEILVYTVAEGAANRVRGPWADPTLTDGAPLGAALLARFVTEVVRGGDVENADALMGEGLRSNGPLYGLGWQLAGKIEASEGPRAVGEWQRRGAEAFVLRANALATEAGEPILAADLVAAIQELQEQMDAATGR